MGPVAEGTRPLFCAMSPQGPALRGTWAPGAREFAVCWGLGHKVCTDRANPSPELRTPTIQQLTTQVHTGGSGPQQVALFLNGRHLGSLWRSLLGPQTHTTRASENGRQLAGSGNVSAATAEALAQEEERGRGPKSPCSRSLQLQGSPARRAESRRVASS